MKAEGNPSPTKPSVKGLGNSFRSIKTSAESDEACDVGKDEEEDIVRIGNFLVNVSIVTKDALKSMRTYWPMEEYRLLKNRKSARICR